MVAILLTGTALIREHGTIEHLLVMPVTPFEIMTSKVWAMALVVPVEGSVPLDAPVRTAAHPRGAAGADHPRRDAGAGRPLPRRGLAIVRPQFVALAAIGSACFGIALARFRTTIATHAARARSRGGTSGRHLQHPSAVAEESPGALERRCWFAVTEFDRHPRRPSGPER